MKKLLLAISILFLLGALNLSFAGYDGEETGKFVEKVFKDSISIAKNKSLSEKERKDKLSDVINESVDTNWIAKFVIGKYWKQITETQQQEFITLYQSYLIKTYVPKFQNYGGGDIRINKIVQKNPTIYFVQSEFDSAEGKVVNVDFRVIHKDGRWLITDIIPEGISFIVTQRSEVNSAISTNGFDEFMKQLEEKQR